MDKIEANSFGSCRNAISSLAGRAVALLSVSRAYLNQVELSGWLHYTCGLTMVTPDSHLGGE